MISSVIPRRPLLGAHLGDVGRLELVKVAAFLAMVADHVDLVLYERAVPWLHQLGAFAFPAFALTFGIGLARSRDPCAVARRLVVPGLLAQAAWWPLQPAHPVNMLLVFATLAAVLSVAGPAALRVGLLLGAALGVGAVGEGGIFTVALVFGGYAAGLNGRWWPLLLCGGAWVAVAPSYGAVAALLAVAVWPANWPRPPRGRGWLAWGYPAHLLALAGLAAG